MNSRYSNCASHQVLRDYSRQQFKLETPFISELALKLLSSASFYFQINLLDSSQWYTLKAVYFALRICHTHTWSTEWCVEQLYWFICNISTSKNNYWKTFKLSYRQARRQHFINSKILKFPAIFETLVFMLSPLSCIDLHTNRGLNPPRTVNNTTFGPSKYQRSRPGLGSKFNQTKRVLKLKTSRN